MKNSARDWDLNLNMHEHYSHQDAPSAKKDSLWARQFCELAKEAHRLHEQFLETRDVDALDKAEEIFNICRVGYNLQYIGFEEFIEIGKSLRARQAFKTKNKDLYEYCTKCK